MRTTTTRDLDQGHISVTWTNGAGGRWGYDRKNDTHTQQLAAAQALAKRPKNILLG